MNVKIPLLRGSSVYHMEVYIMYAALPTELYCTVVISNTHQASRKHCRTEHTGYCCVHTSVPLLLRLPVYTLPFAAALEPHLQRLATASRHRERRVVVLRTAAEKYKPSQIGQSWAYELADSDGGRRTHDHAASPWATLALPPTPPFHCRHYH